MLELGRPDERTAIRKSSSGETTPGTVVKQEEVRDIGYLEPAESLLFDEETNEAYDMLKEAITQYCAVYTRY